MKKYILVIYMMAAGCTMLTAQTKNTQTLMPLTERVNVQADSARINQIIDGCWGSCRDAINLMPFSVILPTCLMASPPIALNSKPKTIHWKVMRKEKRKDVPSFHIAMQLLTILGDYLPTFIRKHRSQRQFIITGRELVRKEVPATMSFRFLFLLL